MNKDIFFNLLIISFAIGLVLGGFSVIPYCGLLSLILVLFFSAPASIVLMIMLGKLDLSSLKDSIIQGAFCGFCSNFTFSLGYCITTALIYTIWQYTSNYLLTAMIIKSSVFLLLLVIIFTGFLVAVTNAFSGLCTYYIINYIRDMYEKNHIQK